MDDYLEAFVREGEDHVTNLNNALLELESDPGDEAAMDAIFRKTHTLKGNFGAMGFEDASDLAHAVEDLLDAMREGDLDVTSDRMDRVFEGVDEIEACLDDIEATGDVQRDVSDIVSSVRAVLDEADADGGGALDEAEACSDDADDRRTADTDVDADGRQEAEAGDVTSEDSDDAGDLVSADIEDAGDVDPFGVVDEPVLANVGDPVFHVRVEMGDSQMKGVDAMFVLEAAGEAFDLLGTDPSPDAICDGTYDEGFDLVVASDAGDVAGTVRDFPKLSDATVTDLTDDVATTASNESTSQASNTEKSTDVDTEKSVDAEEDAPTDAEKGTATEASTDTEIQSVRVDVDQVDELHGLVEQLVTTRIKLRRGVERSDRTVENELDELDKISASLQDTVMDMRLVPMGKIAGKFPRLVRDLAREQDKDIEFVVEGGDVELDRTILTEISDPLMHLLRNAVDHGIEPPAEREAAGKDPEGTVTLSAERDRDRVVVEVRDDGSGIDRDRVREKAVAEGVKTRAEVEELSEAAVEDLVFRPGFSTNDEVTDVSGRGVGMDVVRDTVTRLDGSVSVSSVPGEGTTFTMTLPVTVAIVNVLFVESGGEEYGIPIKTVEEISRMRAVKTVDGEKVVTYDESVYPLVRLGEALNVPGETNDSDGMLVRIRDAERQVAVHCDDVRGQEEVVVKPFEGILSGISGLSGAAVLGEGDVVTILDVATL